MGYKAHNKKHESDSQMLLRVGIKFAVLAFILLMFDSLLDWFLQLVDLLIELFHIGVEVVEYSIEILLEHFFHTSHQQSEIIIVNGMNVIFLLLIFIAYKKSPRVYDCFKRKVSAKYQKKREYEHDCWQIQTTARKVKIVLMYTLCFSSLLFLVTL